MNNNFNTMQNMPNINNFNNNQNNNMMANNSQNNINTMQNVNTVIKNNFNNKKEEIQVNAINGKKTQGKKAENKNNKNNTDNNQEQGNNLIKVNNKDGEKEEEENKKKDQLKKNKSNDINQNNNNGKEKKKKININDNEKEEEEKIDITGNNVNLKPPEVEFNIYAILDQSEDFATFCTKLSTEKVDFNRIDFSKEPLTFWNCFKAFFLTLFDGVTVECGFWNRMCLRVFFENAISKGESYHFMASGALNSQSQNSNRSSEAQYQKNITCLGRLIKDAQQEENKNPVTLQDTQININK